MLWFWAHLKGLVGLLHWRTRPLAAAWYVREVLRRAAVLGLLGVVACGDAEPEPPETLTVQLSAPENALLRDDEAEITIGADDTHFVFRISDSEVLEGDGVTQLATFVVSMATELPEFAGPAPSGRAHTQCGRRAEGTQRSCKHGSTVSHGRWCSKGRTCQAVACTNTCRSAQQPAKGEH